MTSNEQSPAPRCASSPSLNLAYFGVEMAMALSIGSVSLLADSVQKLL